MKVGHSAADTPATVAAKQTPQATDASKAPQTPAAATPAIPTTAESSSNVALSSAATSLMRNESSADFDAEKVARISSAIADGSFKIDAHVIADKLIGNAKELLTKVQS